MIVLGLESSCDETSAAILDNGKILANQIYTQEAHSEYGGVVPEIASRAHIKKISTLTNIVFQQSNIKPQDLDLIAVTDRPGLAGALLVGISYAYGLHTNFNIPITGVNHLEGHIASVLLEHENLTFPFLSLVISGGHTAIYIVEDYGKYTRLGQTIDDAAGEAFDKIGKMIGFSYPAGRDIEKQAKLHNSEEFIKFPVAKLSTKGIDFSFSGLKTAVKYHIEKNGAQQYSENNKPLICYSFQQAVIKSIVTNMDRAVKETGIDKITMVGGVACNGTLREALRNHFNDSLYCPTPRLCTDNAAMIAKSGYENYKRGIKRFPKMSPSGLM